MRRPTRRSFLAGLAALAPTLGCAGAPETAPPPRPRPEPLPARAALPAPAPGAPALDPRLPGRSGCALLDLATGRLVEGHAETEAFLPASVAKVPTALYALETLGEGHRFATRILGRGPVRDGVLRGDLVLAGGGDPHLDTDALAGLAARLAATGIRRVEGRFLVDGSALPYAREIDPDQPVHVAYNPSVAGLNLNFNRVWFEWKPEGGRRALSVEARATRHSPPVPRIAVEPKPRRAPVFTWEARPGGEYWTVAEAALGAKGGRWLPVRDPLGYAGEVFRGLAAARGLVLPPPEPAGPALPGGEAPRELARVESAPLSLILREMLHHSTNLTAEAVGLAASRARGVALPEGRAGLAASGAAMAGWIRGGAPERGPDLAFANHSGLSADTVITPSGAVRLLAEAEALAPGRLRGLLRPVALEAGKGEPPLPAPVTVAAKTGTLNFVRGLAGYIEGPNRRPFAFAIFAADLAARARAGSADLERPEGSRGWIGRARAQELALLRDWLRRHCSA